MVAMTLENVYYLGQTIVVVVIIATLFAFHTRNLVEGRERA